MAEPFLCKKCEIIPAQKGYLSKKFGMNIDGICWYECPKCKNRTNPWLKRLNAQAEWNEMND